MISARSLFRTRSPERDNRSDAERRRAIAAVIERQRQSAMAERYGLETRMNDAYARAASLLETSVAYERRGAEDETAIRHFEKSAEAARKRIKHLDAEIALFHDLLDTLNHRQGSDGTDEH